MKPKPLGTPTPPTLCFPSPAREVASHQHLSKPLSHGTHFSRRPRPHRLSGRVISASLATCIFPSRLSRARDRLSSTPLEKPPNHPQIPTLSHVTHASGGSHWVNDAVWWSVVRVVVMMTFVISSFRKAGAGKADNEQNRDWEIPQGKLIRCPPALVRMMTFMPNCRDCRDYNHEYWGYG